MNYSVVVLPDFLFFVFCFLDLFLVDYSCRGDSQESRYCLYSRSPLYLFVVCGYCQDTDAGEIHRRGVFYLKLSFSPL